MLVYGRNVAKEMLQKPEKVKKVTLMKDFSDIKDGFSELIINYSEIIFYDGNPELSSNTLLVDYNFDYVLILLFFRLKD